MPAINCVRCMEAAADSVSMESTAKFTIANLILTDSRDAKAVRFARIQKIEAGGTLKVAMKETPADWPAFAAFMQQPGTLACMTAMLQLRGPHALGSCHTQEPLHLLACYLESGGGGQESGVGLLLGSPLGPHSCSPVHLDLSCTWGPARSYSSLAPPVPHPSHLLSDALLNQPPGPALAAAAGCCYSLVAQALAAVAEGEAEAGASQDGCGPWQGLVALGAPQAHIQVSTALLAAFAELAGGIREVDAGCSGASQAVAAELAVRLDAMQHTAMAANNMLQGMQPEEVSQVGEGGHVPAGG